MEILCFFAGLIFVYTKSFFPLLFIAITFILRPSKCIIYWFLAAVIWALVHQWWAIDKGMPKGQVIANAILEGEIVSIPVMNPGKSRFHFMVTSLNNKVVKATVLLSCYYHCPSFKAGQKWHFQAKLKRATNLGNPGGFDYVGWLKARHIAWTGYIKQGSYPLGEASVNQTNLLVLREHLADSLRQLLPESRTLGILQALTLGITNHLSKQQWDLFRRTGTTHLMVISGAHIGLVAGIAFGLTQWLWSRSRWCLYYPAKQAASIVGLLLALAYALLAGFAVPAQRALLACFFLSLRNFLSYRLTAWQTWRYALFTVLLFEPHAVLLPGFYLSFFAVAILLAVNELVSWKGIKKIICMQVGCLFGLMPFTLYWFSYGAVNGLLANLLAIPLVGFFIVPFALISLCLVQWINNPVLMFPVHWAIECLLHYLTWIDSLSLLNFTFPFTQIQSLVALVLAIIICFLFPLKRFLPVVIVLTLTSFFPAYEKVRWGEARINILDVGQGLAIVIRTAYHTLIYDTGVKFYQGGDMGNLAIIPFLTTLNIKKIDKVVISHPDLDHRGGLPSLEKAYSISELIVDNIAFYHRGVSCHNYPAWQWDGISFRFLAINKAFHDKNNNSCVLQIENKAGKILLTGDIEKLAEDYLVENYGNQLPSAFLVVPHHGSQTSSSLNFIRHVAPQYAVISAGFNNRYHFPHRKPLKILEAQKATIYNTADCGMVTVNLASATYAAPNCYKWTKWHD